MKLMAFTRVKFCFAVSLLLAFKVVPAEELGNCEDGGVYHLLPATENILPTSPLDYYYSTGATKFNAHQENRLNHSDDRSTISLPEDYIVKTNNSKKVERINFGKGKTTHLWKGTIWNGEKYFKLWMKKGQKVRLDGSIYLWDIKTIHGQKIGCDGAEAYSCPPETISEPLPYSGDYIIGTSYRMSTGANSPVSKSIHVSVEFEVH